MGNSFQNEVPKSRVNLQLDLHTGGAGKKSVKDFEPEQVARNIPSLRALISMRNLLRDLKANLLDNVEFRRELEKIMKDPAMSSELRAELTALAP